MAQHASYFQQNVNNPPPYAQNVQQVRQNQGFIVVDQRPPTRSERFPYSLPIKCIFAFSITECVIASFMIILGIVNLAVDVRYLTTYIAFPIWCGLTVSISRPSFTISSCKQSRLLQFTSYIRVCLICFHVFRFPSIIYKNLLIKYTFIVTDIFCHGTLQEKMFIGQ